MIAPEPTSRTEYTATYIPMGVYEDPLFVEESAIIELLADGVLMMCGGYQSKSDTIELAVICNDLFWWATADAEHCLPSELQGLYDQHKADPIYGSMIWVIIP